MNYQVIYFTRTGNSKRVAEKLAKSLACAAIEIRDNVNWNGFFGFMKGGYYASFNKNVDIKVTGNIDDVDELVLVTPMWAGKITPAAKAFLKMSPIAKINLVVTSGGSSLKERAGFKSVTDVCENQKNEDIVLAELVKSLQS
ncbi:MAG: hypothetical protein WCI30_06110 [Clostridia bacterium]